MTLTNVYRFTITLGYRVERGESRGNQSLIVSRNYQVIPCHGHGLRAHQDGEAQGR